MPTDKLAIAIEEQRNRNLVINTATRLGYKISYHPKTNDPYQFDKGNSTIVCRKDRWYRYIKLTDKKSSAPVFSRSKRYESAVKCLLGELELQMPFKPGQVIAKAKRGIRRFTVLPVEAQTTPEWVVAVPTFCNSDAHCSATSFPVVEMKLIR